MTLLDFEELMAYWTEHPPLHLLVAAYLSGGRENRKRISAAPLAAAGSRIAAAPRPEIGALLSELGPGFGIGDIHVGLTPAVLDFAELKRRTRAID
jgi:hypothetical protein